MAPFDGVLSSEAELREIIRPPHKRAADKQIDHLDAHCRAYIAHAPFAIVATTNADGTGDAAPLPPPPGFTLVHPRLAWTNERETETGDQSSTSASAARTSAVLRGTTYMRRPSSSMRWKMPMRGPMRVSRSSRVSTLRGVNR
jgi:predicted pyridoxine 5'-phosphate oxidase superfamily flavin-nucleotide-binding protein